MVGTDSEAVIRRVVTGELAMRPGETHTEAIEALDEERCRPISLRSLFDALRSLRCRHERSRRSVTVCREGEDGEQEEHDGTHGLDA